MRTIWRALGVAATVALCAVAAACGGGDETEAATAPPDAVVSGSTTAGTTTGAAPRVRTSDRPVAAVQDDHLPVTPIEAVPERVAMISELGARVVRFDIFWSDVARERPAAGADPADAAYDWTRVDLTMRELAAADITPIISVYNTPVWASDGPAPEPGVAVNTATPDPEAYGEFMEALATRYRGDFRPADGRDPLPVARRFEIWNEPNLGGFLRPQVDDEGTRVSLDNYAALAKAAYPAIKRANPQAIVIAGVGGPRSSSSDSGTGALDWLRGLREREIPLDAYSQHIYPAAAPTVATDVVPSWSTVPQLLDELDQFRPGLQLYITEAGYTTSTTPYRATAVTEAQQAQYLREIFQLPQLRGGRIPVVVQFNLQDNANWPAGLLRDDSTPKPAYGVYREIIAAQRGATLAR